MRRSGGMAADVDDVRGSRAGQREMATNPTMAHRLRQRDTGRKRRIGRPFFRERRDRAPLPGHFFLDVSRAARAPTPRRFGADSRRVSESVGRASTAVRHNRYGSVAISAGRHESAQKMSAAKTDMHRACRSGRSGRPGPPLQRPGRNVAADREDEGEQLQEDALPGCVQAEP